MRRVYDNEEKHLGNLQEIVGAGGAALAATGTDVAGDADVAVILTAFCCCCVWLLGVKSG